MCVLLVIREGCGKQVMPLCAPAEDNSFDGFSSSLVALF